MTDSTFRTLVIALLIGNSVAIWVGVALVLRGLLALGEYLVFVLPETIGTEPPSTEKDGTS